MLVDVEISVNIRYGYDIRGEVVGEDGTAALGEASPVRVRRAGLAADRVPADWRERFARAYDVELQEWVDAVAGDGDLGPSSWDGYAAAAVVRGRPGGAGDRRPGAGRARRQARPLRQVRDRR